MKKVTINMVAEKAGVSKSTVSRVISDSTEISQRTKEKVIAVMEELNYHPSAIARSLVSRKSMNIGLVLPSEDDFFLNPFFQQSLRAISKEASDNEYEVMIVYSNDEIDSIKRVINANKVDGLILMRSQIKDKTIEFLRDKNIKYVLIGKSLEHADVYSVNNDNIQASYDVTKRLIKNGCKKIGFISGENSSVVTIDRCSGYKKALKNDNLTLSDDLIRNTHFSENFGKEAMKDIISNHPDLDAVIITDDLLFRGALEYLNSFMDSMGKSDKKMHVAVFGSSKEHLSYRHHPNIEIVCVDINAMELGETSCKKLIDLLNNKNVSNMDLVDYHIGDIL